MNNTKPNNLQEILNENSRNKVWEQIWILPTCPNYFAINIKHDSCFPGEVGFQTNQLWGNLCGNPPVRPIVSWNIKLVSFTQAKPSVRFKAYRSSGVTCILHIVHPSCILKLWPCVFGRKASFTQNDGDSDI